MRLHSSFLSELVWQELKPYYWNTIFCFLKLTCWADLNVEVKDILPMDCIYLEHELYSFIARL